MQHCESPSKAGPATLPLFHTAYMVTYARISYSVPQFPHSALHLFFPEAAQGSSHWSAPEYDEAFPPVLADKHAHIPPAVRGINLSRLLPPPHPARRKAACRERGNEMYLSALLSSFQLLQRKYVQTHHLAAHTLQEQARRLLPLGEHCPFPPEPHSSPGCRQCHGAVLVFRWRPQFKAAGSSPSRAESASGGNV